MACQGGHGSIFDPLGRGLVLPGTSIAVALRPHHGLGPSFSLKASTATTALMALLTGRPLRAPACSAGRPRLGGVQPLPSNGKRRAVPGGQSPFGHAGNPDREGLEFEPSDAVEVKPAGGKGLNAFTRRPICKREVIERVSLLIMDAERVNQSPVARYVFYWGKGRIALALQLRLALPPFLQTERQA